MSACRSCGREIIWGTLPDGKNVPLDPKPPVYRVRPAAGGDLLAGAVVEVERDKTSFVSHFVTCANPAPFSGKNRT